MSRRELILSVNGSGLIFLSVALFYLTLHDGDRAWKGFDWDTLNRLHEGGFISNPVSKAKSVRFTEKGLEESERVFRKLFAKG